MYQKFLGGYFDELRNLFVKLLPGRWHTATLAFVVVRVLDLQAWQNVSYPSWHSGTLFTSLSIRSYSLVIITVYHGRIRFSWSTPHFKIEYRGVPLSYCNFLSVWPRLTFIFDRLLPFLAGLGYLSDR